MIFRYWLTGSSRGLTCRAGFSITWFILLSCCLSVIGIAGVAHADSEYDVREDEYADSFDNPTEPSNLLPLIDERRAQRDSLFPVSPLGWLRDETGKLKQDLYDATGLMLGLSFTHVFQGLSESIPGEDKLGTASILSLTGSWDLINKGKPTLGQVVFQVEGRWDYGTRGPEDLGTFSLESLIGTSDSFSKYSPAFILRNLYWRQGSPEAGWVYRIGKISPDGLLGTSAHISPFLTFLPSGGIGAFSIALPDSGLGAVGAWYINDRVALAGLVSDANADRYNEGDIGKGDFFKAVELHVKIAPRTPKAGYSKLTLWQTDGTKDGEPANGEAGPWGWGVFVKHEQELTADGRAIGILRYGKCFNDSAVFDQQFGAHFLLYEPRILTRLKNDLVGVAFNWAKPTTSSVPGSSGRGAPPDLPSVTPPGPIAVNLPMGRSARGSGESSSSDTRSEYNVEVFYRFPIFPNVDMTLSYQSVINPAFTRDVDHASVFNLRIRTVF